MSDHVYLKVDGVHVLNLLCSKAGELHLCTLLILIGKLLVAVKV